MLRKRLKDVGQLHPGAGRPRRRSPQGRRRSRSTGTTLQPRVHQGVPGGEDRPSRSRPTGVYGGYYCQAINATAPASVRARLWQEFLYSDAGSAPLARRATRIPPGSPTWRAREGRPRALLKALPSACALREGEVRRASAQQTKAKAVVTDGVADEGRVVAPGQRRSQHPKVPRGRTRAGRGRPSLAWLGVVPFFALHAPLPLPACAARCSSAPSRASTAASRSRTSRSSIDQPYIYGVQEQHRGQPRHGCSLGGVLGLPDRVRRRSARARRGSIRSALTTFSGVAANFGGIPLAFAFIATLGTIGIVTQLLVNRSASTSTTHGFSLCSTTRRRDHVPLLPDPADDPRHRAGDRRPPARVARGIGEPRREPFQFWRYVGVPVLMPSLLGAMILLFGNSFAAYATAYGLTSGGGATSCRS